MASLNRIILVGRLVRDPAMRATPSGTSVVQMRIAVDRRPTPEGKREADFIDIVAFNKVAESCGNNLTKGRLIAVDGRLRIREFMTQDGQRKRVPEVIANNVQFLDRPREVADVGGEQGRGEKIAEDIDEDMAPNSSSFANLEKEE